MIYFNPLPPHGGRRREEDRHHHRYQYFNPLPPHGGRPHFAGFVVIALDISIHSLRMEGDFRKGGHHVHLTYFNPLPPHGGRPDDQNAYHVGDHVFQSTPSAWRETLNRRLSLFSRRFQSTPSAWRETSLYFLFVGVDNISIHSLRMEGDIVPIISLAILVVISIHSLRMEGDIPIISITISHGGFQSTPSAWRETLLIFTTYGAPAFQSTPSAWRETDDVSAAPPSAAFQSTPSAWRETLILVRASEDQVNFNPLPPHGGRPRCQQIGLLVLGFQSTPSAWRET